jgi:hypothetical protein
VNRMRIQMLESPFRLENCEEDGFGHSWPGGIGLQQMNSLKRSLLVAV